MKPATKIAFVFLNLVALFHALRLVFELPITVGSFAIPSWPSVVGAILFALLAAGVWREHRSSPAA